MGRTVCARWVALLAAAWWVGVPAALARAEEPPAPAPVAAGADEGNLEDLDDPAQKKADAEAEKREEAARKEAEKSHKWGAKSDKETEEKEKELAMQRTVGRRTGRFLVKARELLLEQKFKESNEVLARLNMKRLNNYERALVLKNQAYNEYGIATSQAKDGQGDPGPAIKLLQAAIAENILPKQDVSDIRFQIAQMQMAQQDFKAALASLQEWFANEPKPSAAAYFALAIANYQLKDEDPAYLEKAVEPAKKAIELAGTPQQSWLQLLLAIYLNKSDYAAATPVLVTLLTHYPDVGKAYWIQLSTLYGVQKDVPRALAVMQLAHRRHLLDEDATVRKLAQLLQSEEIPIRSVKVLEQGFAQKVLKEEATSFEMLGNSWILAREASKAEPALRKAADLSPKGDLFVRLGQVLLLKDDYDGAKSAFKSGLAKGGIDDPGSVELLLGITYYNAGQLGEARTWFAKSRRSEKSRPMSDAWLKHIDEELGKQSGEAGAVGL
jgi:tetratricopeptide repeat protein